MTEAELTEEKERLLHDDLTTVADRVRHAFNQGYALGYLKSKGKQFSYWDRVEERYSEVNVSGRRIVHLHYECHYCRGKSDYQTKFCPHCGAQMDSKWR